MIDKLSRKVGPSPWRLRKRGEGSGRRRAAAAGRGQREFYNEGRAHGRHRAIIEQAEWPRPRVQNFAARTSWSVHNCRTPQASVHPANHPGGGALRHPERAALLAVFEGQGELFRQRTTRAARLTGPARNRSGDPGEQAAGPTSLGAGADDRAAARAECPRPSTGRQMPLL